MIWRCTCTFLRSYDEIVLVLHTPFGEDVWLNETNYLKKILLYLKKKKSNVVSDIKNKRDGVSLYFNYFQKQEEFN